MSTPSTTEKSLTEANREFFNATAPKLSEVPWVRDVIARVTQLLKSNVEFLGLKVEKESDGDGKKMKMLDYACGNGTASLALAPFIPHLRGIDLAPGMVAEYKISAQRAGFDKEKMFGITGDLLVSPSNTSSSDQSNTPEFCDFDLVIMSMALHHVGDCVEMVRKLAQRTKEGGVVGVVDWVCVSSPEKDSLATQSSSHDHHRHGHGHAHGHHIHTKSGDAKEGGGEEGNKDVLSAATPTIAHRNGFTESEMLAIFSSAGLKDGEYRVDTEIFTIPGHEGDKRKLFLARGVRGGGA